MVEKKAMLPEQETADLVDRIEQKTDEDVFELSSGVVLRLKDKINPSILIDILSELETKRPEPPVVYLEQFGREEVNYDDPKYQDRLQRWEVQNSGRIADALVLKGTEVESIPDDLDTPDDNGWIEELEVLGFTINRFSKSARYLAWVKHVAIEDKNDWEVVIAHVGKLAGVNESDVKRAQSAFPHPGRS